jgi:putative multiple sugar transport system substrate-binding protein
MLNRRAVLAGAASLAVTLTACGKEEKSSTGARPEGLKVGVAMPTRSSERWLTDGKGVAKRLQEMGYKPTLEYGDDDPKAQVAQIDKMIDDGVRALVIAAIDNRSLNGVLRKAAKADITVVSYDRLILGTKDVDYYVSFDNEMVGRMQARYIIKNLGLEEGKGPFTIELFAGSPDDNNTKYFFEGSMALLRPWLEKKKLIVPSGETEMKRITTLRWDGPTAQRRMTKLLNKWYRTQTVDAVLSPYDGISRGVLDALTADGYGTAGKPLPIITGQDAELDSVKLIIQGKQSQTVYKDVRKLAVAAAELVDDVLSGRDPWVDSAVAYRNGVKAVPAVLLQPTSIDKSNYDTLIKDEYFSEDQLK